MQTALQEVEMQLQMLAVSARQVHGIMRMKCALHLDGECLIRIFEQQNHRVEYDAETDQYMVNGSPQYR